MEETPFRVICRQLPYKPNHPLDTLFKLTSLNEIAVLILHSLVVVERQSDFSLLDSFLLLFLDCGAAQKVGLGFQLACEGQRSLQWGIIDSESE